MKHELTSHKLTIEPYSQWEHGVSSSGSACGPATMAAITEYWSSRLGNASVQIPGKEHFGSRAAQINHLYSRHGGRPWGMSVRGFLRGLRAFLRTSGAEVAGSSGVLALDAYVFNDWEIYKAEIDAGRPVAVKFDKWTGFRWRGQYAYDYHWVVGIGYEETLGSKGHVLIVHDNGSRYTDGITAPGEERRVNFAVNRSIITMVGLSITAH
jgi:hypothetical protein